MTHDRSESVPLPAAQARCEPSKPGAARGRCARYQAAIKQGSPLGDYSIEINGCAVTCSGYVAIESLRKQADAPRKIHPPIGGRT